MPTSLLPPNATALERAASLTAGARLDAIPARIASLWSADTCPESLLPYLAWALSVDEWDSKWGIDRKRDAVRNARRIHQQKGTRSAVRLALASVGQPDAGIVERGDYVIRNGSRLRDGTAHRQGQGGWSTYRVVLRRTTSIQQAQLIRRLLASVQRNCITLTAIDFRQAALRRNGEHVRAGTHTRGVVNATLN